LDESSDCARNATSEGRLVTPHSPSPSPCGSSITINSDSEEESLTSNSEEESLTSKTKIAPIIGDTTGWDEEPDYFCAGLTIEQIYEEFQGDLQEKFNLEIGAGSVLFFSNFQIPF